MPDLTPEEMKQFVQIKGGGVAGEQDVRLFKVAQEATENAKAAMELVAELRQHTDMVTNAYQWASLIIANRDQQIHSLCEQLGNAQPLADQLPREVRHSEKRRVEIQRMQAKLDRRRQQVKHLHRVIDNILAARPLPEEQPAVKGAPCFFDQIHGLSYVNDRKCAASGGKDSRTGRYTLQVDASDLQLHHVEDLLQGLEHLKRRMTAEQKALKVDVTDVSEVIKSLTARGYNDDAAREFIQILRELQ